MKLATLSGVFAVLVLECDGGAALIRRLDSGNEDVVDDGDLARGPVAAKLGGVDVSVLSVEGDRATYESANGATGTSPLSAFDFSRNVPAPVAAPVAESVTENAAVEHAKVKKVGGKRGRKPLTREQENARSALRAILVAGTSIKTVLELAQSIDSCRDGSEHKKALLKALSVFGRPGISSRTILEFVRSVRESDGGDVEEVEAEVEAKEPGKRGRPSMLAKLTLLSKRGRKPSVAA